jgi:hypothetical protein
MIAPNPGKQNQSDEPDAADPKQHGYDMDHAR